MTAELAESLSCPTPDPAPTRAVRALDVTSGSLPEIGLAELDAGLGLQIRVDRKYFVPADVFERFAALPGLDLRALDIHGRRLFGYETTYFDSSDLVTYRAHLQGRRRRFKVRVRSYVDSGTTHLEVKLKGPHGETVKHRRPHPAHLGSTLTRDGHGFVAGCVAEAYGLPVPSVLEPALITANHRATFASSTHNTRLTCDVAVTCRRDDGTVRLLSDHLLVETKSGPGAGGLDLALRSLGMRPVSVSKYCVGIATLHPDLPGNPWHRVLRRYFESVTPASLHPLEQP
ncbi:MAG: polyphosphate polymerase domain-containing protein [Nocardioides sp.]